MLLRLFPVVFTVSVASALVHSPCGTAAGEEPWPHGAAAVVADPRATEAAVAMLERGGHAVDAAIAAHLVLGLVEPQSSGLGGGGFMLVYERGKDELVFHEGRETAPRGARTDMFVEDGKPLGFLDAWQSGLSVGVPGIVALYRQAHERHGRLGWAQLFEPAIRLAEEGFEVSPRLAEWLPRMRRFSRLHKNPATSEYFYPGGQPLQPGQRRDNPAYASTLRRIAREGPAAFYRGEVARAIVDAVQAEPRPGSLDLEDLEAYLPRLRPVVCGPFREVRICGAAPPSSGMAQLMISGLYDELLQDPGDLMDRIVAFVDAQRLAYADRDHYIGDPNASDIPLRELTHPRYLRTRAGDRFAPGETPAHGDPGAVLGGEPVGDRVGADSTQEVPGTTHLSIIDGDGNAVSLTATVEAPFGSQRWAAGFLLNNELTDFAREYSDGKPHPANAVAPGRRPRSSMSPTLLFDGRGDLLMVTGSPGGNSIPAYVAKSILGVLDWGLSLPESVAFPNIVARGRQVRVETGSPVGERIAAHLSDLGYPVQEREGENSGINAILVTAEGLVGAADARREGTVARVAPSPESAAAP